MERPSVVPTALANLRLSVPSVLPVVTGTFQVTPPSLVLGVPTAAPAAAAPLRLKLEAVTPVFAAAKVSVQFTVERFVMAGFTRFKEVMVVGAARPPKLATCSIMPELPLK